MPELPEVETIKEGLRSRIKGLEIKGVEVRAPLFKGNKERIVGAKVENIWRRAKVLVVDLDNDYHMAIHLKMTGQLVFQGADEKIKVVGGHPQREYNQPLPHGHTHIIIDFTDGSRLYFNDLRKFGWMMVVTDEELAAQPFIKKVGPEPLGKDYTFEYFMSGLMGHPKIAIKTLIMNQEFIAGVGNIYSDEALWAAQILPDRKAGSLMAIEAERLFKVIPFVLLRGIKYGGTSDSTFIGVNGERGDYLKVAYAYHQAKDPRGHKILTKKINGRTAHYCEICQR